MSRQRDRSVHLDLVAQVESGRVEPADSGFGSVEACTRNFRLMIFLWACAGVIVALAIT